MKRSLLVGAVVAALALPTPTPARADFHAACPNGARALVSLTQAGGTFTFTGRVKCDGAVSAAITELRVTPVVPPGAAIAGSTASCGPCGPDELVATGAAPAAAGVYDVRMAFTATGLNGKTYSPTRLGRYTYAGSGQPTLVCGHASVPCV